MQKTYRGRSHHNMRVCPSCIKIESLACPPEMGRRRRPKSDHVIIGSLSNWPNNVSNLKTIQFKAKVHGGENK